MPRATVCVPVPKRSISEAHLLDASLLFCPYVRYVFMYLAAQPNISRISEPQKPSNDVSELHKIRIFKLQTCMSCLVRCIEFISDSGCISKIGCCCIDMRLVGCRFLPPPTDPFTILELQNPRSTIFSSSEMTTG